MLDRTKTAQILQIVDVDMPVVDLIAALAQEIADHVLARPFGAAGRGNRDKIPRGGKLGVEAGIDGIEDFFLGIDGIHGVAFPVISRRRSGRNQIILCRRLQERDRQKYQAALPDQELRIVRLDRFQNRARTHTLQGSWGYRQINVGPDDRRCRTSETAPPMTKTSHITFLSTLLLGGFALFSLAARCRGRAGGAGAGHRQFAAGPAHQGR